MEIAINMLSDITYKAELIPDALFCEIKRQVLIRTYNLLTPWCS